jgi:hypothetical protein
VGHTIGFGALSPADDFAAFAAGLCDQQAVERIAVVLRQLESAKACVIVTGMGRKRLATIADSRSSGASIWPRDFLMAIYHATAALMKTVSFP